MNIITNQETFIYSVKFKYIDLKEGCDHYDIIPDFIQKLNKFGIKIYDMHYGKRSSANWEPTRYKFADDKEIYMDWLDSKSNFRGKPFIRWGEDGRPENYISKDMVKFPHWKSMKIYILVNREFEKNDIEYAENIENYSTISHIRSIFHSTWHLTLLSFIKIKPTSKKNYKLHTVSLDKLWNPTCFKFSTSLLQDEIFYGLLAMRRSSLSLNIKLPKLVLHKVIKHLCETIILPDVPESDLEDILNLKDINLGPSLPPSNKI